MIITKNNKNFIGSIFYHPVYGEYEVIEFAGRDKSNRALYKIKFKNTNSTRISEGINIKKGNVKDNFSPVIYGVGYIGDGDRKNNNKEYRLWMHVLERCYNKENINNISYKNTIVCDEWLNFKNFCEDIKNFENYNKWLETLNIWTLDKDKKQQGIINKIYSKDTCVFITNTENSKLVNTKVCHENEKRVFEYKLKNDSNWMEYKGFQAFARENNLKLYTISQIINKGLKNNTKFNFKYKNIIY